jgi:F420-0:gamma-glutamyl ligase
MFVAQAARIPADGSPNPRRRLEIQVAGQTYLRIPVHTPVVTEADDILEVADRYAGPHLQPGDILFISEKVLAITQGRAIPIEKIRVSLLAKLLWPRVAKVPYGVGLRSPYSMQCAIDECGAPRILLAAVIGAVTKLMGRKGDFYRIAGKQAAMIDAAGTAGIDAFKGSVIKGPKDPDQAAQRIADRLQVGAAVVDVNDIGGSWAVGASRGVDRALVEAALKDNPLGQGAEQTPCGILRKLA